MQADVAGQPPRRAPLRRVHGMHALGADEVPHSTAGGGVRGVQADVAGQPPCRTARGGNRPSVCHTLGAAELRLAVTRVLGCRINSGCALVAGVGLPLIARVHRIHLMGRRRVGEHQRRRQQSHGHQHQRQPPRPATSSSWIPPVAPGAARSLGRGAEEIGYRGWVSSHRSGSPIWYAADNCLYPSRTNPDGRGGKRGDRGRGDEVGTGVLRRLRRAGSASPDESATQRRGCYPGSGRRRISSDPVSGALRPATLGDPNFVLYPQVSGCAARWMRHL